MAKSSDFSAQGAGLTDCSTPIPPSTESVDVPLAASPVSSEELAWDYRQLPLSGTVGSHVDTVVNNPAVPPDGFANSCLQDNVSSSLATMFSGVVTQVQAAQEEDFTLADLSPLDPSPKPSSTQEFTCALDKTQCSMDSQLSEGEVLSMEDCLPSDPVKDLSLSTLPQTDIPAEVTSVVSSLTDIPSCPDNGSLAASKTSSSHPGTVKKRKLTSDLPPDFMDEIISASPTSAPRLVDNTFESAPLSFRNGASRDLVASPLVSGSAPPPVILIKPANDLSTDLTRRPDKFASSFAASPFGKIEMEDIRLNKRAGLVAVQLPQNQAQFLPELLQVS